MKILFVLIHFFIVSNSLAVTCSLKTKVFNEDGKLRVVDGRIIRIKSINHTDSLPIKGINLSLDLSLDLSKNHIEISLEDIYNKKYKRKLYEKYGEKIVEYELSGYYKTSFFPFSEELKVESTLSCIVDIS